MNKLPKILLLMVIVLGILSGCSKEEWTGFVYPNKNDLTEHRNIGTFSSLEQCRDSALSRMSSSNWFNGDYECGLNCENSSYGGMLCDKTLK
jgi:hypothetical protein